MFFLLLPPPAAAASVWGVRAHPDTIAWRKFGTFGLSKSTCCVATSTSSERARQRSVSRYAHTMTPDAGQVPLPDLPASSPPVKCFLRTWPTTQYSIDKTRTPHRKDCDRHTEAETPPPTPRAPDNTRDSPDPMPSPPWLLLSPREQETLRHQHLPALAPPWTTALRRHTHAKRDHVMRQGYRHKTHVHRH